MTAIYDRRSGQTHLIVDPVPEILDAIGGGTATAADVAARMRLADAAGAIAERLDELLAIGLVERV